MKTIQQCRRLSSSYFFTLLYTHNNHNTIVYNTSSFNRLCFVLISTPSEQYNHTLRLMRSASNVYYCPSIIPDTTLYTTVYVLGMVLSKTLLTLWSNAIKKVVWTWRSK